MDDAINISIGQRVFGSVRRYVKNVDGATAIEQSLVGAMVAIALLVASKKMGNPVEDNPDFGQISAVLAASQEPPKDCDATPKAKAEPPRKLRLRSNRREARTKLQPLPYPCEGQNTTPQETQYPNN